MFSSIIAIILIDQIRSSLTNGSLFQLISQSFLYNLTILDSLFAFWYDKMFQAILHISFPDLELAISLRNQNSFGGEQYLDSIIWWRLCSWLLRAQSIFLCDYVSNVISYVQLALDLGITFLYRILFYNHVKYLYGSYAKYTESSTVRNAQL